MPRTRWCHAGAGAKLEGDEALHELTDPQRSPVIEASRTNMKKAPQRSASAHQRRGVETGLGRRDPLLVRTISSLPSSVVALQTCLRVHVRSDAGDRENGTAGPFRNEPASLQVMTATGQADARRSCRVKR
jgi:hypothetical protein